VEHPGLMTEAATLDAATGTELAAVRDCAAGVAVLAGQLCQAMAAGGRDPAEVREAAAYATAALRITAKVLEAGLSRAEAGGHPFPRQAAFEREQREKREAGRRQRLARDETEPGWREQLYTSTWGPWPDGEAGISERAAAWAARDRGETSC